jgi:hypothetical protein
MAALGSQSIASSYEQILQVDRDGGGDTTTHVSVKDGDNDTTFALTLATDAVMITSDNRLEFGDDGTYIHQSANGVLDLVSDTEIEINATTIDINGAVDISGNTQLSGTVTVGVDGTGKDVKFFGDTATNGYMLWDESTDDLILGTSSKLGIGTATPDSNVELSAASACALKITSIDATGSSLLLERGTGGSGSRGIHAEGGSLKFSYSGNEFSSRTDHMLIDEPGAVTKPLQPAFLARPASSQDDIAVGSSVDIVFGTEVFDQGADFASNTFTAPVAGRYQINASIALNAVDSASSYYSVRLLASNRTVDHIVDPDYGQDAVYLTINANVLMDMDASDTVKLQIIQGSGTQQTDIATDSTFSGFLAC